MNPNNGQPCKILLTCNGGTHILVTNSDLIGLINRWKIIPHIANTANYLAPVKSWASEERVLPPLPGPALFLTGLKCLFLYPQISVILTSQQRSSSSKHMATITENHNWSKSREQLTTACSAPVNHGIGKQRIKMSGEEYRGMFLVHGPEWKFCGRSATSKNGVFPASTSDGQGSASLQL